MFKEILVSSVKDGAILQILCMCYILLCLFLNHIIFFFTVLLSILTLSPRYQTLLIFVFLFVKKKLIKYMVLNLFILQIVIGCLLCATLLTTENIRVNKTVIGSRGVSSL